MQGAWATVDPRSLYRYRWGKKISVLYYCSACVCLCVNECELHVENWTSVLLNACISNEFLINICSCPLTAQVQRMSVEGSERVKAVFYLTTSPAGEQKRAWSNVLISRFTSTTVNIPKTLVLFAMGVRKMFLFIIK